MSWAISIFSHLSTSSSEEVVNINSPKTHPLLVRVLHSVVDLASLRASIAGVSSSRCHLFLQVLLQVVILLLKFVDSLHESELVVDPVAVLIEFSLLKFVVSGQLSDLALEFDDLSFILNAFILLAGKVYIYPTDCKSFWAPDPRLVSMCLTLC